MKDHVSSELFAVNFLTSRLCQRRHSTPLAGFRTLILLLFATVGTFAQAPPNDLFAGRIPISGASLTATGSLADATLEIGEPTSGLQSVWWAWTAPTSGTYTVTATGSFYYPRVEIFSGSALGSLTSIVAQSFNGLDSSYAAQVTFSAAGGTTYPIAVTTVAGLGSSISLEIAPTAPPSVSVVYPTNNATVYIGDVVSLEADASDSDGTIARVDFYVDFELAATFTNPPYRLDVVYTNGPVNVRFRARATDNWGVTTLSDEAIFLVTFPPPANDNFAQRTALTGASNTITGSLNGATHESGDPTVGNSSVWWSWTAPASGTYIITAVGEGFEPRLEVFEGLALNSLSSVAVDTHTTNDSTYAAQVAINAVGGTVYSLALTTVAGLSGPYTLCIRPANPPAVSEMVSVEPLGDEQHRIRFRTGSGSRWVLETSEDLVTWTETIPRFPSDCELTMVRPASPDATRAFFRLKSYP